MRGHQAPPRVSMLAGRVLLNRVANPPPDRGGINSSPVVGADTVDAAIACDRNQGDSSRGLVSGCALKNVGPPESPKQTRLGSFHEAHVSSTTRSNLEALIRRHPSHSDGGGISRRDRVG